MNPSKRATLTVDEDIMAVFNSLRKKLTWANATD